MKDPPRVVVLAAPWSLSSRALEARLRRAGLRVRRVDVDAAEGRALREAHAVEALPAVFVVRGGRAVRVQAPSPRTVRAALARAQAAGRAAREAT